MAGIHRTVNVRRMRHLPRAALLAALLVVAALLGACGSKSDGGGLQSSGVLRVGTEGT